jgi:hypothetical protein
MRKLKLEFDSVEEFCRDHRAFALPTSEPCAYLGVGIVVLSHTAPLLFAMKVPRINLTLTILT